MADTMFYVGEYVLVKAYDAVGRPLPIPMVRAAVRERHLVRNHWTYELIFDNGHTMEFEETYIYIAMRQEEDNE